MAIPIDDTLLYVEPLYLSAESRQLPELKRLIASTGDRVVMAQTVESLLAALVTPEEKAAPPVVTSTSAPSPGIRANESPPSGANAEALNHYRRAFEALNKGDWRTFGAEMDAMQKALQSVPGKIAAITKSEKPLSDLRAWAQPRFFSGRGLFFARVHGGPLWQVRDRELRDLSL